MKTRPKDFGPNMRDVPTRDRAGAERRGRERGALRAKRLRGLAKRVADLLQLIAACYEFVVKNVSKRKSDHWNPHLATTKKV